MDPPEKNSKYKHRIEWDQLKFFHKNPPKYSLPKSLKDYNMYKNRLSNVKNIYLYLIEKYFKNNDFFILEPAEFPYYVDININHRILWFNPKFYRKIKINDKFIEQILKKKINNNKYIYFENKNVNKSIKNIIHVHVFTLQK
tara:strand:- start:964 stop:1389 length:426 start_codon:yes stop_codon:yes gene_type:complete